MFRCRPARRLNDAKVPRAPSIAGSAVPPVPHNGVRHVVEGKLSMRDRQDQNLARVHAFEAQVANAAMSAPHGDREFLAWTIGVPHGGVVGSKQHGPAPRWRPLLGVGIVWAASLLGDKGRFHLCLRGPGHYEKPDRH